MNHFVIAKKSAQKTVLASILAVLGTVSAQSQAGEGLVSIYQMALQNDPLLAQAQAQLQADDQAILAVKGGLYPQISANGSLSLVDTPSANYDSTEMSVTLNQALYQQEVWARYDQSKTAIEVSKLSVDIAQQNLIVASAQAYFKVLLAKQNLELFKTKEKSDLTQLESAKASEEVGLASRVDVLQAQSSYDLSRSDRISAENSLDIANEELAKLIGKRIDESQLNRLLMTTDVPQNTADIAVLQESAQNNNLAVKQAKASLDVTLQEVEVQKSGYWPSVSLQARIADTQYNNFSSSNEGTSSSISVNVSVPLYTGGTTQANIDSSKFKTDVSQQKLRDAIDSAKLNARTQWRNIQQGQNLIAALREAVKSNDAFLEAAEEGYKVGLKDLLEVLSARANQVQARKNLIEALHNQVLNLLQLEAVLGDLTLEDLQRFDALLVASEM